MKLSYDYDLIVIGAGIVGMVSAVMSNGLGKRVAVIEMNPEQILSSIYQCWLIAKVRHPQ